MGHQREGMRENKKSGMSLLRVADVDEYQVGDRQPHVSTLKWT